MIDAQALWLSSALSRIKAASTALSRRIAAGELSPETIARAAAAMPAGKSRQVKPLGYGGYNTADLRVGNIGGEPGLVARKLPIRQMTAKERAESYQAEIDLSQHLHRKFGDKIAPYIHADETGLYQRVADKQVLKSWKPEYSSMTADKLPPEVQAELQKVYGPLKQHGVGDIEPRNLGPGGQLLDWQFKRHGQKSGYTGAGSYMLTPQTVGQKGFGKEHPYQSMADAFYNSKNAPPYASIDPAGPVKVSPSSVSQKLIRGVKHHLSPYAQYAQYAPLAAAGLTIGGVSLYNFLKDRKKAKESTDVRTKPVSSGAGTEAVEAG